MAGAAIPPRAPLNSWRLGEVVAVGSSQVCWKVRQFFVGCEERERTLVEVGVTEMVAVGVGMIVEETGGVTIGPSNSFQQYRANSLSQISVLSTAIFARVLSITAQPSAVPHSGSESELGSGNPE